MKYAHAILWALRYQSEASCCQIATLNRCPGSAASTRHLQFVSTYHLFNVRTGNVVINVSERCAVEYNYNLFF